MGLTRHIRVFLSYSHRLIVKCSSTCRVHALAMVMNALSSGIKSPRSDSLVELVWACRSAVGVQVALGPMGDVDCRQSLSSGYVAMYQDARYLRRSLAMQDAGCRK